LICTNFKKILQEFHRETVEFRFFPHNSKENLTVRCRVAFFYWSCVFLGGPMKYEANNSTIHSAGPMKLKARYHSAHEPRTFPSPDGVAWVKPRPNRAPPPQLEALQTELLPALQNPRLLPPSVPAMRHCPRFGCPSDLAFPSCLAAAASIPSLSRMCAGFCFHPTPLRRRNPRRTRLSAGMRRYPRHAHPRRVGELGLAVKLDTTTGSSRGRP
jgi:hypothetical protein